MWKTNAHEFPLGQISSVTHCVSKDTVAIATCIYCIYNILALGCLPQKSLTRPPLIFCRSAVGPKQGLVPGAPMSGSVQPAAEHRGPSHRCAMHYLSRHLLLRVQRALARWPHLCWAPAHDVIFALSWKRVSQLLTACRHRVWAALWYCAESRVRVLVQSTKKHLLPQTNW